MVIIVLRGVRISWDVEAIIMSDTLTTDFAYSADTRFITSMDNGATY
jgi:hypothetical protein